MSQDITTRVSFCIVLFGVLLPLIALCMELTLHWSAMVLFDPIPTWAHILLVASVPLANGALAYALYNDKTEHLAKLAHINAFVIGISAVYAVMFLPLLPIGVIAIIWFGIGFLFLSPLLSLWSAIRLRALLGKTIPLPGVGRGLCLGLALLAAAESPFMLTNIGLHMATSTSASAEHLAGIRWLRALGDDKTLLRLCYERSGISSDWLGMLLNWYDPVDMQQTQTVFYRVTGQAFNELPKPMLKTRSMHFFDTDVGGEVVGERNHEVELVASRMDGIVDAQASTAYLEWTMVLKNNAYMNNEGRAQILLPPGAVVSRLTLWIDGEEREAAFGGRSQVRQAYQQVVAKNRDPVLVTTQGKDRILLQLFPIPMRGGEMKARIGITVPLILDSLAQGRLQLPVFRERNFEINTSHSIWLESKTPLLGAAPLPTQPNVRVQAELNDAQLEQAIISAPRDASHNISWRADGDGVVLQQITQQNAWQPQRVVLVVDGSQRMAAVQQQISSALSHLPNHVQLGLVLASDETQSFLPVSRDIAQQKIKQFSFVGGHDNTTALSKAWQWASATPNGAVVWIHSPQPILLDNTETLLQLQQRSTYPIKLFQLEAIPGANKLMAKLDGFTNIENLPRIGSVSERLSSLFQQWRLDAKSIQILRQRMPSNTSDTKQSSVDHIVRLWAAEQVANTVQHDDAVALGQHYQLVTPVTGAVVLETQQQYQAAGLEPVAPNSVPTIPEPETWLMLLLMLGVLAHLYGRHKRGLI